MAINFNDELCRYAQYAGYLYDILPSVIMAQARLESGEGKSKLSIVGKNLFGVKATKSWRGKVYNAYTKECYDGINLTTVTGSFRAYDSWGDSITDYCKILNTYNRYKNIIGNKDYKDVCKSLYLDGYATDPNYSKKLVNIIEKNNLTKYDMLPSWITHIKNNMSTPDYWITKCGDLILQGDTGLWLPEFIEKLVKIDE